jgi:hypothetical protein
MKDRQPTEKALERWATDALRQLPQRKAPASLAPRILAAVARAEARPWYMRPWSEWPDHFRWMTVLVVGALLAAALQALAGVHHAALPVLAQMDDQVASTIRPASVLVNAMEALGRGAVHAARGSLGGYGLAACAGLLALIWGSTIGFGATCWRLAGERNS